MKSNRLLRVGSELKRELAQILTSEMEEYRGKFITVTEVRLSKDLAYADVWVSVMGDKPIKDKIMQRLAADAWYLRKALAGKIYLRHLPELRFFLDNTLDYAEKIDRLLQDSGVDLDVVKDVD